MGVGKSPATGMLVVLLVQLCMVDAWGAEVCRFMGASDYDGHVAVTTDVTAAEGVTKVDVTGTFEATTMFWFHIRYLIEEVSTSRDAESLAPAVETRHARGDVPTGEIAEGEDRDGNHTARGHHVVDEAGGLLPEADHARGDQTAENHRHQGCGETHRGQQAKEHGLPLNAVPERSSLAASHLAAPQLDDRLGAVPNYGSLHRGIRSHRRNHLRIRGFSNLRRQPSGFGGGY